MHKFFFEIVVYCIEFAIFLEYDFKKKNLEQK